VGRQEKTAIAGEGGGGKSKGKGKKAKKHAAKVNAEGGGKHDVSTSTRETATTMTEPESPIKMSDASVNTSPPRREGQQTGSTSTTSADSLSEQEYSSDSGKGGSDTVTPADSVVYAAEVEGDVDAQNAVEAMGWEFYPYTAYSEAVGKMYPTHSMIYEFEIPQLLVGRLIGRFGAFVNKVKDTTGASIMVKRHHISAVLKICAIEGVGKEIEDAIEMIRERFPVKQYPCITLAQVIYDGELPTSISFLPANNKLNLIEGVVNDVSLGCVVSLDHIFFQQPTHPTFPALTRLHHALKTLYQQPGSTPKLIQPFSAGVVCVAQMNEDWYRAEVVALQEDENAEVTAVTARLVDVGGYVQVSFDSLRQIRSDFITIPFQATECRLANVIPKDEEGWSQDAINFFKILVQGHVLHATVISYSVKDNVTLIYLYKITENRSHIMINQELVTHGYAKWIEHPEVYTLASDMDQLCQDFAEEGTISPPSSAASSTELSEPSGSFTLVSETD